jgi:hypothetical protein
VTPPRRTLFWKYAAYVSGLVSALLVLSGGVGGYFAYRESTSGLESLQRTKAEVVAHEIATFLGRLADDLQSVAAKFNTSGGADEEDLRAELVTLLRHQPSITELHWISADGRERFALSRVAPDTMESGRDWSKDARFAGTRDTPRYIGPVYFRRETEPYLSLAASRTGGPVIVAEVNLKFVWDVISHIRVGAAGIAYVVDRRGQLVSHSDISLVLRKPDVSTLPQVRGALARDDPFARWAMMRGASMALRPSRWRCQSNPLAGRSSSSSRATKRFDRSMHRSHDRSCSSCLA